MINTLHIAKDWNTELKIQQNIPEQHPRLPTLAELKEICAEPSDEDKQEAYEREQDE